MTWFTNQRQEWIGQMLNAYGFINRKHLMRHFGISLAQAALDFTEYNKANPDAMTYDAHQKAYISSK